MIANLDKYCSQNAVASGCYCNITWAITFPLADTDAVTLPVDTVAVVSFADVVVAGCS